MSRVTALSAAFFLVFGIVGVPTAGAQSSSDDCDPLEEPQVEGAQMRWHPMTLTFEGPCTSEDAEPNPFLDYRLTATFTHTDSKLQVDVPGFYAADGTAAETGATAGNRWRVHFTPWKTGEWTYEVSFRRGPEAAIRDRPNPGTATAFDGTSGAFTIAASDKSGRDHRGKGFLRHVGERYLRFDDGTYFLKGGADSPENLLAYADFDGTRNNSGTDYVRAYEPHVPDWTPGDPTWQDGKGKGLIGALNYLASEGMNAFSFLTMNVTGDGDDVWPWTGPRTFRRYDVSKLAQWEIVFRHSDRLGLFKHFKTQETENDHLLDGGILGQDRKLYYRELIARFAHHHALNWNLGEENTNTPAQRKAFAEYVEALDPYNHPIVIHSYPNQKDDVYASLTTVPSFDGPSLQLSEMDARQAHRDVRTWLEASAAVGAPWNVSVDEPGTASAGLRPDSDDNYEAARAVLWTTYFAGADGLEWYFGYDYPDDDLNADDWRSRDAFWAQHRSALDFMRDLPFRSMTADDDRLSGAPGAVFSDQSDVFAVYLESDAPTATLDLPPGSFDVRWFNPRTGGTLKTGSTGQVQGGEATSLGSPPAAPQQDWVVKVTRVAPRP
jgi:hypothetical protein